jgi:ketosteroid isomerase-like protein
MRGLKLHPMVQRVGPDDPRLRGALAALAGYGLPLYVHTGFEEFYGWSYPVAELEAIAERHPEIRLVLCHANYPNFRWAAAMARRFPNVWLDLTSAPLFWHEPGQAGLEDDFRDLFAAAPDRIVFGTDHPSSYELPRTMYEELLAWSPDLGPVLRDNARRLVGVDELDRADALDLVQRLHAAQTAFYTGGDDGPVRALLADDVEWHVPGANAIAGDYRGREAVLDYFARRRDHADSTFRLHTRDLLTGDGDHLAALTDGTATIAGAERRWSTVGLYRVRDDQIAACWLLPLDPGAFDEIWAG